MAPSQSDYIYKALAIGKLSYTNLPFLLRLASMPRAERFNVSPHTRRIGLLYQCVRVVYAYVLQCKSCVCCDIVAASISLRDGRGCANP